MQTTSASVLVPPPPARSDRVRSDALDEVIAEVARCEGQHSRVVHGVGPLRYERAVLAGRTAVFGWSTTALAQTIRGAVGELTEDHSAEFYKLKAKSCLWGSPEWVEMRRALLKQGGIKPLSSRFQRWLYKDSKLTGLE